MLRTKLNWLSSMIIGRPDFNGLTDRSISGNSYFRCCCTLELLEILPGDSCAAQHQFLFLSQMILGAYIVVRSTVWFLPPNIFVYNCLVFFSLPSFPLLPPSLIFLRVQPKIHGPHSVNVTSSAHKPSSKRRQSPDSRSRPFSVLPENFML